MRSRQISTRTRKEYQGGGENSHIVGLGIPAIQNEIHTDDHAHGQREGDQEHKVNVTGGSNVARFAFAVSCIACHVTNNALRS